MDIPIQMVDLKTQYDRIAVEVDGAIQTVLRSSRYVNGPAVKEFESALAAYLGVKHVIGCANGTDALQISLMALGLQPGDEVIVPSFTFIATAEVIGLLRLTPIMVDVDPNTFNVRVEDVERAITNKTKAIVPVHLFGQAASMQGMVDLARKYNLFVVEDNAQSMGADYQLGDDRIAKAGTIGDVGCTSFFPAKNLGCYGDGGAIFTNNDQLAEKIKMVANHGQSRQYYHDVIGVNSRLDTIQAAVLKIKLEHLDGYNKARGMAAALYDDYLAEIDQVQTPKRAQDSSHVFHQYTIQVPSRDRDQLKDHLQRIGIPSNIYYPVPMYRQKAFAPYWTGTHQALINTEALCQRVLSLPMHTELDEAQISRITDGIKSYFS